MVKDACGIFSTRNAALSAAGGIRFGPARGIPHRLRPCCVMRETRDDMDMQLRHHVAQRGDVHFMRAGDGGESSGDTADFLHHRVIIVRRFRSCSSRNPSRRGTKTSQGKWRLFISSTRQSGRSPMGRYRRQAGDGGRSHGLAEGAFENRIDMFGVVFHIE